MCSSLAGSRPSVSTGTSEGQHISYKPDVRRKKARTDEVDLEPVKKAEGAAAQCAMHETLYPDTREQKAYDSRVYGRFDEDRIVVVDQRVESLGRGRHIQLKVPLSLSLRIAQCLAHTLLIKS